MYKRGLVGLLVAGLLTGCGGDDDGDGGNGGTGKVDSGIDDAKQVNMLSQAELDQLSQSYAKAISPQLAIEFSCKFTAVTLIALSGMEPTADDVQACNDLYDQCVSETPADSVQSEPLNSGMDVPSTADALAGCNATVGELEACLTASLQLLQDLVDSLSCESATMLATMPTATAMTPAACESLDAECTGGT